MAEREQSSMPEWARKEREGDLAWIRENIQEFWTMAQVGYQDVGRGSIFVDVTVTITHEEGQGNLMGYVDQATVEELGDEDTQRMVREYDPETQFVTTFLKSEDRMSSYRVGFRVRPERKM